MTPALAIRAVAATLLTTAIAAAPALAQPAPGDRVRGEVIVGLADGASAATRAAVERRTGVDLGAPLTTRGARLARVPGDTVDNALARLVDDPAVRWAEPNRVQYVQGIPNDPSFGSQWSLLNTGQSILGGSGTPGADIGATAAWDVTTGSDRVKVAVLDGGVDASNADLGVNIGVVNPGEAGDGRESNGIDDDANGLVDDWRGWDFSGRDNDPADDSSNRHGTTAAGVMGARGGDGIGIAGVSWTSRIIPVRGLGANGVGSTADLAAGITYAASMGARILNASFGGPQSTAISEAIAASPQMLVVAAAGNGGVDGVGDDSEGPQRLFPCSLPLENIVCVAATDQSDQLASFSNFGSTRVDLAAPGVRILGPASATTYSSGTSFSAPLVSGTAALVLATNPTASTRQLRRALLESVDPVPALAGEVATGGRLDAARALTAVPAAEPGPGGETGPATDLGNGVSRVNGTLPSSSSPLAYWFEYGTTTAYGSSTVTRPIPAGAGRAIAEDVGRLPAGALLHHRLVVASISGMTFGVNVVSREPVPPPPPPPPVATTRAPLRPVAVVRRSGRNWVLALTLRERVVVSALLQRRRAATANRTARFVTVRGLRRRGLPAGRRTLSLGRLPVGNHRVRVTVIGSRGTVVLTRGFTVRRTR